MSMLVLAILIPSFIAILLPLTLCATATLAFVLMPTVTMYFINFFYPLHIKALSSSLIATSSYITFPPTLYHSPFRVHSFSCSSITLSFPYFNPTINHSTYIYYTRSNYLTLIRFYYPFFRFTPSSLAWWYCYSFCI